MPLPPEYDICPPAVPYAQFVEGLGGRRAPTAADIFDRWDLRKWQCGSMRSKQEHSPAILSSDRPAPCKCGFRMVEAGLAGLGERRAYLAWMLEIMEPEEAMLLQGRLHIDTFTLLAVVPMLRMMYKMIGRYDERLTINTKC